MEESQEVPDPVERDGNITYSTSGYRYSSVDGRRKRNVLILDRQIHTLSELILSEEMVNYAAASFRIKVNYILLVGHHLTLGKDFRFFFMVVGFLWLLSVLGNKISFFTLAYIGMIILVTLPAFYNRYEEQVDRCAGTIHRSFRDITI